MLYSIGTAGILICFSRELGDVLYPNSDTAKYIRLLSPLIPIMYLDTATDAMLKGLGEQNYSMKINVLDALISVIMVWILVPLFGIDGYLISIYVSELFNTVFSMTRLLYITKTPPKIFKWVLQPLFCIIVATHCARCLFLAIPMLNKASAIHATIHCIITALFYFGFLVLTKTVNREELFWSKSLLSFKETSV